MDIRAPAIAGIAGLLDATGEVLIGCQLRPGGHDAGADGRWYTCIGAGVSIAELAPIIPAPAVADVAGRRYAAGVAVANGKLRPGGHGASADSRGHVRIAAGVPITKLAIAIPAPAVAQIGGRRYAAGMPLAGCQLRPGRHDTAADGHWYTCIGAGVSIAELAIVIPAPAVPGVAGRFNATGVEGAGGQLRPGCHRGCADGGGHVRIAAGVPVAQLAIAIPAPAVASVAGRLDAAGVVTGSGQLRPGGHGASADGRGHVHIAAGVPVAQLANSIVAPAIAEIGGRGNAAGVGVATGQLQPGGHCSRVDCHWYIRTGTSVPIAQLAIGVPAPAIARAA